MEQGANPPEASIITIVLAGSRPGRDPLAAAASVSTKALVPVGGRPMIDHVARALIAHRRIGTVVLMAQQPEQVLADPKTAWLGERDDVRLAPSGGGISQSLLDWIGEHSPSFPLLVTTADNVLLDGAILDAFLAGTGDADVAAAMVEQRVVLAAYPGTRRTWLRFRRGAWSGANLFWLGSAESVRALEKWREIEQDRKKGWKIVSAFGPVLLAGAALRLFDIHQAIARAGRRLGVTARIVPIPVAEACIDADKPEDVELIEAILARRGS